MRLTRQAEIAVQILALCARPPSNAPVTTRRAAEFAGTTKDHAAQVVVKLARAGYLIGTRGRGGGIRLALAASNIKVGDVIRTVEPSFGVVRITDSTQPAGPFDAVVHAAVASFVSTFDSFTIGDLVACADGGRIGCLDCDLHTLFRRGNSLSQLRRHSAFGNRTAAKPAVHAA